MNKNSRTKNSIINMITSVGYQFSILIIAFITRRIFIENLGVDYLGIGGLFTNLLEILALAELGIGSAISFSMYKEIAENNHKKLKALNTYYKNLYNRIAIIVLVIGLTLLPFLKYLIKLENEIPNVEIYYLIYLFNTVFSYLFVYKTTIVTADQKDYKLKIVSCGIEILKAILQVISLIIFRNFLVYLLIQIFCTLLGNFIKSKLAEKWYPFIKEEEELPKEEKKAVWNNIKSMFFYKFGGVAMNNTTNILTSILVNTTMVGYYSNYTMIYNKINSFITLFFSSILASIGNLNVTSTNEKKYEIYKTLSFVSYWMFALASIGIFFLAEDIVTAMSGSQMFILEKSILIISVINFYIQGILHPNSTFRQTTGLFKMAKHSMLMCALLNLILAIILGNKYGLLGILLATMISRLLTNVWYEPYLLYRKFFGKNPMEYYKNEIKKAVLCIGIIFIMMPIIKLVMIEHLYIRIIVKFIICFIIPNIVFFIIFRKTKEFNYILKKIEDLIPETIKEKIRRIMWRKQNEGK